MTFTLLLKKAFYKSLPVMAGYMVLGIGFGILLRNAGYGALWAFSMSLLIYAGSMQYVGVGLLAGGASVITTIMTTIMVNARHLFYSISMVDHYKDAGPYKPYLIFALTDETYSLLCDGKVPDQENASKYRFFVSLFDQSYWVIGSVLGNVLPPAIIGMLVIYCLKDVSLRAAPFWIPELIATVCVIALQVWRRNSLISILTGTVVYMLLIRVM